MFYSKSTGGFYSESIHGENIPSDALPISDDDYHGFLDGQSAGLRIVADAAGLPVLEAPPAPTLSALKTLRNTDINTWRAAANAGSFSFDGKIFSCDQLSRGDIDGVNGFVSLTGALPPGFPGAWKAIDNSYLAIPDVAAWTGFYGAMVAAGAANFSHAQTLKAQLAAAATAEEVAAIVW